MGLRCLRCGVAVGEVEAERAGEFGKELKNRLDCARSGTGGRSRPFAGGNGRAVAFELADGGLEAMTLVMTR